MPVTTPDLGLLGRLEDLSTSDGHAFDDVDWGASDHAIPTGDERLSLPSFMPEVDTPWFTSLPADDAHAYTRARIASALRIGWEFENILQRGLLVIAYRARNGDPTFRYLHHEVIEESQHTLMFNELVARLDPEATGMGGLLHWLGVVLGAATARWNRPLFYLLVLGGELPIDHVQRRWLREEGVHPLVAEVIRIHVTEEARHVSFARHEIQRTAPRMGPIARGVTSLVAPVVFGVMTRMMIHPTHDLRRRHGVPRRQLRRATSSERVRQLRWDSAERALQVCEASGLVGRLTRPLWRLAIR